MARKPNGYQEIRVTATTFSGPFKVNMGVRGRRLLTFPTLGAARAWVEGFSVDAVTYRIGSRRVLAAFDAIALMR